MAAGVGNIYIEQYSKWEAIFKFYQDDKKTIPVNFTGYSNPKMQIRESPNSPTIIVSPTVKIDDVANGCISATLTSAETGAMTADGQTFDATTKLSYDLVIDDLDGQPIRLLNGTVLFSPGVSR